MHTTENALLINVYFTWFLLATLSLFGASSYLPATPGKLIGSLVPDRLSLKSWVTSKMQPKMQELAAKHTQNITNDLDVIRSEFRGSLYAALALGASGALYHNRHWIPLIAGAIVVLKLTHAANQTLEKSGLKTAEEYILEHATLNNALVQADTELTHARTELQSLLVQKITALRQKLRTTSSPQARVAVEAEITRITAIAQEENIPLPPEEPSAYKSLSFWDNAKQTASSLWGGFKGFFRDMVEGSAPISNVTKAKQ